MENRYFKKDPADPIAKSASVGLAQLAGNSSSSTSKKSMINQHRPSRMKMMTTTSTSNNGPQNGAFTPFSSHNYGTNQKSNGGGGGPGTGQNFYLADFKKSCATFSSTLRNFQDDSNNNAMEF